MSKACMQEQWHPYLTAPNLWAIVEDELIELVYTKHPVVVIIDDARNLDLLMACGPQTVSKCT